MIPYRDSLPTRRPPYLTWGLIALNVFAFLYEQAVLEAGHARIVLELGFVPWRFLHDPLGDGYTLATSMFLHGGVVHLLGNMIFLWVFGDNVEDRLGRGRFVTFYLLSGVAAAFGQMLIDPSSHVPMIGASGAIAGVLGAYLVSFPRAPVGVWVPPIFAFELPAWAVIGEWFVIQLVQGVGSLALGAHGGVAFFAHIGGFVAGIVLLKILAPDEPPPSPLDDWVPPPAPS